MVCVLNRSTEFKIELNIQWKAMAKCEKVKMNEEIIYSLWDAKLSNKRKPNDQNEFDFIVPLFVALQEHFSNGNHRSDDWNGINLWHARFRCFWKWFSGRFNVSKEIIKFKS